MCSDSPPERPRPGPPERSAGHRLSPRRWSLRARLLAGQILLLVTVVIAIGVTTELALQQFLIKQVDSQLAGAQKRALLSVGGGPFLGPPFHPGPFNPVPGGPGPGGPGPDGPGPDGPGPDGPGPGEPGPHHAGPGPSAFDPGALPPPPGAMRPREPDALPDRRSPAGTPPSPGAQWPTSAEAGPGRTRSPGSAPSTGSDATQQDSPPQPTPDGDPGPDFLNRPGVPPDEIGAIEENGTISAAGRLGNDGNRATLNQTAQHQLASVPPTGKPRTATLDGHGRYRVVASTSWDGRTVFTGLSLGATDATLMRVLMVLLIATGVVMLIAITVGITLIRRALIPLDRVAATAARVADLPLDRGEVALPVRVPAQDADPVTEVGKLGAAVNRMLDHIAGALSTRHASEIRVRQFVADASHELRTPLAAIRGYTELAQRNRDQLPETVADAIGRVDAAAVRMSGLVEDLLLLARLDSGRPLEREPVDLTQLTVDAASDAHIAGPEHRWDLELPDEPVVITGDSARLHQVLANLLTNARMHTPPGTTVTVTLTPDRTGGATWHVRDTGPGIPADLQPEIFQRFARGDSSRSRRAGSTGLGLAIADAVVKAHNGTITLASTPGHTEFTVHLPGPSTGTPPAVNRGPGGS